MTIISLEGIDGAGKTTIIPHLAQHLISQGHAVHTHALPTPHGRREAQRYPQGSTACALAYATDMAHLWETTINPAHQQGHTILLDIPPQEAHRRQVQRGGAEQDKLKLAALRRRYLDAAPGIPGALRTEFVRHDEEPSEVVDAVCGAVDKFLAGLPVQ